MNSKFYVPLEAARLLKEKGYDGDAEYAYHENGNFSHWGRNVNDIDYLYAAPTKAEAIDWLEGKRIYISSIVDCDSVWVFYTARIIVYDNKNNYHNYSIFEDNDNRYMKIYKTRLEAEEAAIIKALELL